MSKKTLRILLVIVNILYFTIGAPQSGSAETARSTTATAEARYHPFFPKTAGNGLQGVLHVQNAGTVDAIFQVDFYTEQGTVVKRYYGTVKPYAAHTLAAEAWAELPVGVYGVRVTSINAQPLVTVVRVKETNRTVPGLGFDPGVSQSRLATTFHGGPIYGGAKASTIHLFNPTPATVNGEIILTTLTGTPVAPRTWSLPAYGRTTITFNTQPADFVGTVQVTASTAIAALLQQSNVNDGLELQAFKPPALQYFLPRVYKAVAESDGVYSTKLLVSNPTANLVWVEVSLTANEGQPPTTPVILSPHIATFLDLHNLSGVPNGVYWAVVNSPAPVVLSEITDAVNTTTNANATYAGQELTAVTQRQAVASRLFFPRAVKADYGNSSLNLQNSSDSEASVTIAAYNADGTKNGADLTDRIPARGTKQYNRLFNVAAGFIGSIVISSDRPLVGWMDEYVLTGDEPDPAPTPIDPPAPVASFSAAKRAGMVPLEVQFVNTSEGKYTSSQWDFGDGQSSTVMAPTHTYTQPGVYTVTLTVDGPVGSHTTTMGAYIIVRSTPATNADGWDLDFGNGGYADSRCADSFGKIEVTPDNKLLMYTSCPAGYTLLRFLADGTLDRSFGVQGQVTISGVGKMMALQDDGKIILLNSAGMVTRHLTNGAPDPTFSSSATTPSDVSLVNHLFVQPNDQIIVRSEKGITRFTPNGEIDTTFAGRGYLLTEQILSKPNSDASQILFDIAVQPGGKLLVAIRTRWREDVFAQTTDQVTISRLNHDGSLDNTFANAGRYLVYETTQSHTVFYIPMYVQPNGQILIIHPLNHYLLRLRPDGTSDTTFQPPQMGYAKRFLIDQHGGIIVHNLGEMSRFSADGLPDGNFGRNGYLPVNGSASDVALLHDGSLVVSIYDGNSHKIARNVKPMSPPVPPVAVFLPTIWR